jgi:hypothetical protein
MATMTKKRKLTEPEIDELVVKQANDDSAWETAIHVRKEKGASFSIAPELAARAAFLASLHRKNNVEEWLVCIIQERIELEEAAFIGAKQDLASRAR